MASKRISGPARRQQILGVATEMFATRGFQGTTTKQIAQHARVSEALLFRHFPHKEALYWAVIGEKLRTRGGRENLEAALNRKESEREVFAALAEGIIRKASNDITLTRLLLFSALENHRLSARFFRSHIAGYYEALAEFIKRRVRAGAFRKVDPLVAARSFLGMVVYHYWIQELFGGKRYKEFDVRKVAQAFADIWLQGMRANGRPNSRSG